MTSPSCRQMACVVCWLHLLTAIILSQAMLSAAGEDINRPRSTEKSTESTLIDQLIDKSSRVSRPVKHANATVNVTFRVNLVQIQELDQKKQMMTTHLWKEMRWKDSYLTWDPDQYQDIQTLRLPKDVIWTPDVMLYNIYENRKSDEHDLQAQVDHEGNVIWIPPVIYHSSCQVDLTNFPFDTQLCSLEFGSWIYNKHEMDLALHPTNNISMDNLIKNTEWKLIRYSVSREERKFECCAGEYVIVTYTFMLRRNAGYYTKVMLMPILLLSIAAGFIFCIPAQRPDRTALGLSLFTSFMLLLLLVVDISPPSAESKISTYLSVYVCLVTSAIIISILLINVSTWKGEMPRYLKTIIEPLQKVLHPCSSIGLHEARHRRRIETPDDKVSDQSGPAFSAVESNTEHSPVLRNPRRMTEISDWAQLVDLIDRSLFIIYSTFLVVCVTLFFPRPESN